MCHIMREDEDNHGQQTMIYACYDNALSSKIISWQTFSLFKSPHIGPCHVAIKLPIIGNNVSGKDITGDYWCESTSLCPHSCAYANDVITGCQIHKPEKRLADYDRVDIYDYSDVFRPSTDQLLTLGNTFYHQFLAPSIGYDFRGAIFSGTRFTKYLPYNNSDVLEHVFCSEIIAALLMKIGLLCMTNPTRYNPGKLIRDLLGSGVIRHVDTYIGYNLT